MAKICMISVNHSPLDDRIFYKEACTLRDSGHHLFMICGADAQGIMYDMGHLTPLNTAHQEVVYFNDIPTYPIKHPQGIYDRLAKKIFKGKFYAQYISRAIHINADVYHAHEPESFYLGLQIAKATGAKVIFDAHESYAGVTLKERWIKWRYIKKTKVSYCGKSPHARSFGKHTAQNRKHRDIQCRRIKIVSQKQKTSAPEPVYYYDCTRRIPPL